MLFRARWFMIGAGLLLLAACQESPQLPLAPASDDLEAVAFPDNPVTDVAQAWRPIDFMSVLAKYGLPQPPGPMAAPASSLTPTSLWARLKPGETVTEAKTAELGDAPPKGDVLFSFDLTGSMGGEAANVKANAVAIMGAVRGVIPDTWFGLISYEDYPASYSSCGYSSYYGGGADQPYRLDASVQMDEVSVAAAINAMTIKGGADYPEAYARAFYETYSDAAVGWRDGARRIVVNFGDAIPHDCDLNTGVDPGRDGAVGTADDLDFDDVVAGLAANDVTLINIWSGTFAPHNTLWDGWAAATGGTNYQINSDGTFPGGVDPATEIASLIEAQVSTIGTLQLEPCSGDEAFAGWLSSSPAAYTDVEVPATLGFDLTVGPPEGTPDGVYTFDVCLVGDGAEYGRQSVTIEVYSIIDVAIDIKPGSYPNSIQIGDAGKSKGNAGDANARIAVALFSTDAFDATAVDVASVTLGDGTAPDTPVAMKNNGTYFFSAEDVNGDGLMDALFHFERAGLLGTGDLNASTTELTLHGYTLGGDEFQGSDSVRPVA